MPERPVRVWCQRCIRRRRADKRTRAYHANVRHVRDSGVGRTGQTRPWRAETRLLCMQGFNEGSTEQVKAEILETATFTVRPQLLIGVVAPPLGLEQPTELS